MLKSSESHARAAPAALSTESSRGSVCAGRRAAGASAAGPATGTASYRADTPGAPSPCREALRLLAAGEGWGVSGGRSPAERSPADRRKWRFPPPPLLACPD